MLLAIARLALLVFPFRWVARSLGRAQIESSSESNENDVARAKKIGWAVETMSRYTFWESKCLAQAIAAQWMLKRRGISSTLYLGAAKNETREMSAHAWVRSGAHILTGSPEHERYAVIALFSEHA